MDRYNQLHQVFFSRKNRNFKNFKDFCFWYIGYTMKVVAEHAEDFAFERILKESEKFRIKKGDN